MRISYRFTAFSLLLAVLALAPSMTSTAGAQAPALTLEALRNGTYSVDAVPGGTAKLTNGMFSIAAAPGSASTVTANFVMGAVGTIAGQPGGAVVLVSSGGGTGQFVDLYAVDGTGKTTAKTNLGDRIKTESLSIDANGRIVVDLIVRGPNEPFALPATVPERRVYTLAGGTLTRVTTPTATVPAPAATGSGGLDEASRTKAVQGLAVLTAVLLAACVARGHVGGAR